MAVYGYARVSSASQSLDIQEAALRAAGCEIIRSEKRSGTSRDGRTELQTLIEFARSGDHIVITRVDRLARSIADLAAIVRTFSEKGVHLRATEQPIDTTTPEGRCFLQMLGVFSEFETAIRRERQLEGIAKAKAAGVYKGKGRKRMVPVDQIRQMKADGIGPSDIAKKLGVSRMSVHRALKETTVALGSGRS